MTPLTQRQISRFWELFNSGDYHTAIDYGESLLKMDYRDGAGIRMGVMDAYAILGMTDRAYDFAKNFAAVNNGKKTWDQFLDKKKAAKDPYYWLDKADFYTMYQMAMCLWKAGDFVSAKAFLARCPKLDKYVYLDEKGLERVRESMSPFGVRVGTIEQLVDTVSIPLRYRKDFDNWIKKEVLPEWKEPFPMVN